MAGRRPGNGEVYQAAPFDAVIAGGPTKIEEEIKMGKRIAGLMLVLCLVAGLLAACGGPRTATLRVTVTSEDGTPLANITVAAGGKTGTTNAQGLATLVDVTPGTVTVKLSGEGFETAEHSATVQAGDNALAYQMEPEALVVRDITDITSMHIKVTGDSAGVGYEMYAEIAENGDSRWSLDGLGLISKDRIVYIQDNGDWQRFDGEFGRAMSEAYLGVARVYVRELYDLSSDLSAPGYHRAKLLGDEEANGYRCNVYQLTWPDLPGDLNYTVWVIKSGEYAGYMTRYRWEQTNIGWLVIDAWEFGADIEIEAPL